MSEEQVELTEAEPSTNEEVVANASISSEYLPSSLRKPESVADIGKEVFGLHHVYGFDTARRGNLHFIEDDRILSVAGSLVVFENIRTGEKEFLPSLSETGIGCVTVHPTRQYFAVGGRGFQPAIYIYSYPDLKVRKVLHGGAEQGYACMNFSAEGDKLASVSIAPDYMLTVWDWETEAMGLHAKAFGQDVWNVQFSQDDPRRLTTSGIGHIRFWKMAATFTGLKLQGYIGKFGKIDLSDIENFIELPDGKVVSGTESGSLLLWEGNFIKCRFVQVGGKSCHDASVSYMAYDRREKCVISASLDGTIKWWDFNAIDTAEVDSDQTMDFELLPIAEYALPQRETGVGIKSMIDGGFVDNQRTFVLGDTKGRAQTITFSTIDDGSSAFQRHLQKGGTQPRGKRLVDIVIAHREKEQRLAANAAAAEQAADEEMTAASTEEEKDGDAPSEPSPVAVSANSDDFSIDNNVFESFHAGKIAAVDTSPAEHLAATCGIDGVVRVIDYHQRKIIATRSFQNAATSIRWCSMTLDETAKSFVVGFADGSLRLLTLGRGLDGNMSLLRRMVIKPHNEAITDISFTSSSKHVATAGKDGSVFFLRCRPLVEDQVMWDPVKFISVPAMANNNNNNNNNKVVYCERLCWSPTESTILLTCSDQVLREVDLSTMFDPNASHDDGEGLTFEISLPFRVIASAIDAIPTKNGLWQRIVKKVEQVIAPAAVEGTEGGEKPHEEGSTPHPPSAPSSPQKKGKDKDNEVEEPVSVPLKFHCAAYALNRFGGDFIASASLNNTQHMLVEASLSDYTQVTEQTMGLYSIEAKDYPILPVVTHLRYGWTKRYLVIGMSDGTVQLRPSEYVETFAKATAHNAAFAGVVDMAMSFDDRYIISAGGDGVLVVNRVRLDIVTSRAAGLYKDLDAGVFGEDKVKRPSKNQEDEPKYLTFVSAIHPSLEDEKLFPDIITVEEQELMNKPAFSPDEESKDLPANAYSIQDNRLKLEEDAKRAAADELKSRIRASIRALRKDYEKIVKENEAVPAAVRLTAEEMTVDSEFFEILRSAGEDLLQEVHRECAYQAEFGEKRLQKIQDRLMKGLLIEEMPLYAFDVDGFRKMSGKVSEKRSSISMVLSLRSVAINPAVAKMIEQVRTEVRQQELRESQIRSNEIAQKRAMEAMDEMKQRLAKKDQDQIKAENSGILNEKSSSDNNNNANSHAMVAAGEELSAARLRLQKRKERKDELLRHLSHKPSENDDDERDIRAIKQAEKSIGDYKLKCADDYEVPEDQRINATKKIRQMAMLEDSMLALRLRFNERFLALRRLKREIVYSIRRSNQRIQQIDRELSQEQLSTVLWQPVLDPSEFPDEYEEITESELQQYIENNKNVPWEKSQPPPARVLLGDKLEIGPNKKTNNLEVTRKRRSIVSVTNDTNQMTDFLSDEKLVDFTPERTDQPKYFEVNESLLASGQIERVSTEAQKRLEEIESKVPNLRFAKMLLNNRMQAVTQQSIQQTKAVERRKNALLFERNMTLKSIEDNIVAFRDAVDDLRADRHQVLSDLKLAEFKLLTLCQEYKLLQTFEGRDNALYQKQLRCKGEESEITTLGLENKAKLETKMEEIQHWNDKLAQITQEFKTMLPDNHPYVETLTKIFKKKVKRNKIGDNENEDEEEDDAENEDDEEEDDEEVEDICPPGCDQMLFEKILDLREKKLDTDEICSDIQKSIDDLKKTADRLKQREKQIIKDALQTEQEVQQFQLQKQAALNQIDVVVPLRAGQIYTFEQSGVLTGPTDNKAIDAVDTNDPKVLELMNANSRQLVSHVSMTSHTLFSTR